MCYIVSLNLFLFLLLIISIFMCMCMCGVSFSGHGSLRTHGKRIYKEDERGYGRIAVYAAIHTYIHTLISVFCKKMISTYYARQISDRSGLPTMASMCLGHVLMNTHTRYNFPEEFMSTYRDKVNTLL